MAIVPGLLLTLTEPMDPDLTEAQFNDWYSNKHVVDVVNSGLVSLGARYKNIGGSEKWPYMALYRMPDLLKLYDTEFMASLPTDSPKGWGVPHSGVPHSEANIRFEQRGYRFLKTIEAEHAGVGIPKFVMTTEVKDGNLDEKAFVASYERSTFDHIGKEPGYRRSIFYESGRLLVRQEGKAGTQLQSVELDKPTYLVVHEFDQTPSISSREQGGMGLWQCIAEYGTGLYRIEPVRVKVHS